jgi:hypothetical protein
MPRRLLPAPHLPLLRLVAGLLGAATAQASPADTVRDGVLRMTEFFDATLPGVLGLRGAALDVRPKFSDLRDHEYVRFPVELRYGLGNRWELRAGLTPFLAHPWNTGPEHRWGPGEGRIGLRRDIGGILGFFDETTIGAEVRTPLGDPPVELNDHYTHLRPSVSAARRLRLLADTTFYTNLGYDRSVDLTHRTAPHPEVVRRNIVEVAPGLLFKPGQLGWFGEYRLQRVQEERGWHEAHQFQAGSIWEVPLEHSRNWHLPGKWQLEVGYKFRREQGRADDQGLAARVTWRTSLREVFSAGWSPAAKP